MLSELLSEMIDNVYYPDEDNAIYLDRKSYFETVAYLLRGIIASSNQEEQNIYRQSLEELDQRWADRQAQMLPEYRIAYLSHLKIITT